MRSHLSAIETRPSRGFTLIELLIVMSVIAALMAMMLPAVSGYRERAAVRQNQALISSLVGAMNSFGVDTFMDPEAGAGEPSVYLAWYVMGDGFLDGDPSKDAWPDNEDKQAILDRLLVGEEGTAYRGPAQMLPIVIPSRHIDSDTGRIIDSWGNPLRVLDPPDPDGDGDPYPYGQELANSVVGLGVWSSGPSGDPMNTDDNIVSWSSEGTD